MYVCVRGDVIDVKPFPPVTVSEYSWNELLAEMEMTIQLTVVCYLIVSIVCLVFKASSSIVHYIMSCTEFQVMFYQDFCLILTQDVFRTE